MSINSTGQAKSSPNIGHGLKKGMVVEDMKAA